MHAASFPDEVAPDAPDAEWLDRVTFCHDPADCLWFFLWRQVCGVGGGGGGGGRAHGRELETG